MRRARLTVWGPVVLWAGLIVFSLTRTSFGPVRPLVNAATGALAHLVLWAVLGFLVHRALSSEGVGSLFVVGLAACVAFGVATELLQSLTPGRTPSALDILYDTAGAAAGLWLTGRFRAATTPERTLTRT